MNVTSWGEDDNSKSDDEYDREELESALFSQIYYHDDDTDTPSIEECSKYISLDNADEQSSEELTIKEIVVISDSECSKLSNKSSTSTAKLCKKNEHSDADEDVPSWAILDSEQYSDPVDDTLDLHVKHSHEHFSDDSTAEEVFSSWDIEYERKNVSNGFKHRNEICDKRDQQNKIVSHIESLGRKRSLRYHEIKCTHCDLTDHLVSDCPTLLEIEETQRQNAPQPYRTFINMKTSWTDNPADSYNRSSYISHRLEDIDSDTNELSLSKQRHIAELLSHCLGYSGFHELRHKYPTGGKTFTQNGEPHKKTKVKKRRKRADNKYRDEQGYAFEMNGLSMHEEIPSRQHKKLVKKTYEGAKRKKKRKVENGDAGQGNLLQKTVKYKIVKTGKKVRKK